MGEVVEKSLEGPLAPPTDEPSQKRGDLVELLNGDKVKFDDAGLSLILQNGLETLRLENSLTDVILCVDIQEFSCHRVVLAAASNYFRSARLRPESHWAQFVRNLCIDVGAQSKLVGCCIYGLYIYLGFCVHSRYKKGSY